MLSQVAHMAIPAALSAELGRVLGTRVASASSRGGGCDNDAYVVTTEDGRKVFVKCTAKVAAGVVRPRAKFAAESEALRRMAATNTVRVPRPIAHGAYGARRKGSTSGGDDDDDDDDDGPGYIVMEHLEFTSRGGAATDAALGDALARMHLAHPATATSRGTGAGAGAGAGSASGPAIDADATTHTRDPPSPAKAGFGFSMDNTCGEGYQRNDWSGATGTDAWVQWYCDRRIGYQVQWALKQRGDSELAELWERARPNVRALFDGVPDIQPSLLHGDLWSGNWSCACVAADADADAAADASHTTTTAAKTATTTTTTTAIVPVLFDPASCYGHSEFEFGIMVMFGAPSQAFWDAYFNVIPKAPGFDERLQLYVLYHQLNHYNIFGRSYRGEAVKILRGIAARA